MDANGWFPISTAPKRKGENGRPFKIIVTRSPINGAMPLNVVWWGKAVGGRTWVITGLTPLRYEPTHWRPMLDGPVKL